MVDLVGIEQLLLLTLANIGAVAWILSKIGKNRAESWIFHVISSYRDAFLADIEKNPEILVKLAQPVIRSLAKDFGGTGPDGAMKPLKLTGNKMIDGLLTSIAPRIAERFLGEAAGKAAETANPFG